MKPRLKGNNFSVMKKIGRFFLFFWSQIKKCINKMPVWERWVEAAIVIVLLVLISTKGYQYYIANTKMVPGFGGKYQEAMVGEVKYINPILANNDTEESISKLLFSSLVRYDGKNVVPESAQSWQISPDGLKYTFTLRNDVFFSDGETLNADDVAFTVNQIKNPDLKSPLYPIWKDVNVQSNGSDTVTFNIQKPYGPFLADCDFGILPDHVDDNEFAKKYIGSGPFTFDSVDKTGEKIKTLYLKRNKNYFLGSPYISTVELSFYDNLSSAEKDYTNNNLTAIFGDNKASGNKFSYQSSRKLGLILNLRKDQFKDKALRQKIITGQRLDQKMALTLTTLDTPIQRAKAEEIKSKMTSQNIDLVVNYKNILEMQDVLANKDFELLLYGFDFGHDMDPYPFWHSSQLNALNLAGYSNKQIDIQIEDARQITDSAARNQKYDAIYAALNNEYVAVYYAPIEYNFVVNPELKGISQPKGVEASSRYVGIEKWYLKEKRVRK